MPIIIITIWIINLEVVRECSFFKDAIFNRLGKRKMYTRPLSAPVYLQKKISIKFSNQNHKKKIEKSN